MDRLFWTDNIADTLLNFFFTLTSTAPSLFELVRVAVWIIGLSFLVSAILKLRKYREPGGHLILPTALWQMFFAIICINLNTAVDTMSATFFGAAVSESPLSYPTGDGGNWTSARMAALAAGILLFIKFVGYISFARGITELNRVTAGKAPQGVGVSKGMIHIIGGTIAINLEIFATYMFLG